MPFTAGTRIGPYEIVGTLGAGGMGEVYRARDTRLDRDVAIKVLPVAFVQDPDRLARFDREAKAIAALSHPNILAIYDTGTHDGHPYVVTELLEGETLRTRLASALPARKAIEYAVQIARGLAAAHDKGLVHRDLKPENVFVLEDGQVKILDFGLARAVPGSAAGSGASETVAALTDPGSVLGTVGYMAPEQVRGRAMDARSDLFALGALLYEMVAGRPAFTRETAADTMSAILKEDAPDLTGSAERSPALDRIIRHCLEKNPTERFQSARDVAFALEALSGSGSSTTLSGTAVFDSKVVDRRPCAGLVSLLAVAAATLVVGVAVGRWAATRFGAAAVDAGAVSYQPVTFDQGFVYAARFAANGDSVVYSADWDGRPRDIFVATVGRPEVRALGLPGSDLVAVSASGDLALFPESRMITDYEREGTLSRMSLAGGVPRQELERTQYADIAPDGSMAVVYLDGASQKLEYPSGHRLAESDGPIFVWNPRVSPSGNEVAAFVRTTDAGFVIRVFERGGRSVRESQPLENWWGLAWRSEHEVWFAASPKGESGDRVSLFSLDRSGQVRRLLQFPGAATLHDVSARGDVLASLDQSHSSLEWLDADVNSAPRDVPAAGFSLLNGVSDNRVVAISTWGSAGGPRGAIHVWRPGATQAVRVAEGLAKAIAPDGLTVLVETNAAVAGRRQLSLVPTGPGQSRVLDVGPIERINEAAFHPDGRLILDITRPGTAPAVVGLSVTGGEPPTVIPDGLRLAGSRSVSPDGTHLVARDAEGRLLSCALSNSTCQAVPGTGANDLFAGWRGDNQSLYVYQRFRVPVDIALVAVGTGRRTPFRTLRPRQPILTHPVHLFVLPDGTAAYDYYRSRSQLFIIRGLQ
jgi:hypothetical protein